jgi:8-oxo-dGTP pyrophosphatase MutT (NUDIX family)
VHHFPTIRELDAALRDHHDRRTSAGHGAVAAAVMLLVRDRGGGSEILLGRRATRTGDPWSGHMALPGGRLDHPAETPLGAAVRETIEEVGFNPLEHGRLLGELEPVLGLGNAVRVAVFAAVIETDIEPDCSDELTVAWWAPIDTFVRRIVRVDELAVRVPALVGSDPFGVTAVVWGMTYRVLDNARVLVHGG